MRTILIIIILSFSLTSHSIAQDTSPDDTTTEHHLFEGVSISYEQKYFLSDYQKQFKTTTNGNLNIPCNYVSFGGIGQIALNREYSYPGYALYSYLIPSRITIDDSIKEKLNGYNLKLSLAGQYLIRKKHFGMYFTEGIDYGRLKIENLQKEKLKNVFLAPFAGLVIRLSISKFSLKAITQFDYDLSSKDWRKMSFYKRPEENIPGFKQHALIFSIGLNYDLSGQYEKKQ